MLLDCIEKKKIYIYYGVYILLYRLNSQYFEAPKSGAPKMRAPPRLQILWGGFLRHWISLKTAEPI